MDFQFRYSIGIQDEKRFEYQNSISLIIFEYNKKTRRKLGCYALNVDILTAFSICYLLYM